MNFKVISVALFLFYYIGHYLTAYVFSHYHVYLSYYFDVIFFLITFFIFKKDFKFKGIRFDKLFYLSFLISGILLAILATSLEINIYFNLKSVEILIFLLIVAPILEELVFRFALWAPIETITHNRVYTLFITSFLFSASHFMAYFLVTDLYRPFVIYQTIYTFILGIGLGVARKKSGLINPIIYHFLFNFGFACGLYLITLT